MLAPHVARATRCLEGAVQVSRAIAHLRRQPGRVRPGAMASDSVGVACVSRRGASHMISTGSTTGLHMGVVALTTVVPSDCHGGDRGTARPVVGDMSTRAVGQPREQAGRRCSPLTFGAAQVDRDLILGDPRWRHLRHRHLSRVPAAQGRSCGAVRAVLLGLDGGQEALRLAHDVAAAMSLDINAIIAVVNAPLAPFVHLHTRRCWATATW